MPERIIKPILQHSGYFHAGLWRNQKCKQIRVHRLVALLFCHNPDPEKYTQVNHINEDKTDNRAENLEWITSKENTLYGTGIKRRAISRGEPVTCYTDEGDIKTFVSQADANEWLGLSRNDNHISQCCKGKQKTAYGYKWRYASKNDTPILGSDIGKIVPRLFEQEGYNAA